MPKERCFRVGLALLSVIVLLLGEGCGWILGQDVEIQGRALLAGAPANGNAGISVSIGDLQSMQTAADGSYKMSGIVTGADWFTLTFSMPGYQTIIYSGTIDYTGEEVTLKIEIPTVTLSP